MSEPKPKRKKTARACVHCHKGHMPCDESRPCKRCVSRGLAETCVDAPRKRKKYLMDEEVAPAAVQAAQRPLQAAQAAPAAAQGAQQPISDRHSAGEVSTVPDKRHKFMSNAVDLEYSILSDIIKQDELKQLKIDQLLVRQDSTPSPSGSPQFPYIYNQHPDKSINQYSLGCVQDQFITYPQVLEMIGSSQNTDLSLSFTVSLNESLADGHSLYGLRYKEPEEIYAKINKPFSYTPGFHALINYLKSRFSKQDLVKMAKSMANYRPSFIACTNTLKEDDLIFMEQCFQRTLLEYDKFIKVSGTPTIVWRRTGQICYVSEEFSILTGWSKDQLLNKVTFIVELMDDVSVVEYFDLFSTIAYGDFRGATMTGCTLLTAGQKQVKTTCIWTLKRDVFGIPMMIVGNFLPII